MGNSNISSCCDGISKEKENKEEINLSETNRIICDSIKIVNKMKGQMTMKPKKKKKIKNKFNYKSCPHLYNLIVTTKPKANLLIKKKTQANFKLFNEVKNNINMKTNSKYFVKLLKEDVKNYYSIIKELGSGGFGTVYLVKSKCTDQLRAMKGIIISNEKGEY